VAGHSRFVEQARDAEVGQPEMRSPRTRDVEQEVGGFHITVYDARGVNCGEPMQELIEQDSDVRRRKWTMITKQRGDRPTTHQIHREHDLVVVSSPAVGRDEMRVLDPQRLLPDEPQQGHRIMLTENLRSHVRRPPQIPRPPDRPHPAGPDQVDQPIPSRKRLHQPEPTAPPSHHPQPTAPRR
jgi:hypothetical protein